MRSALAIVGILTLAFLMSMPTYVEVHGLVPNPPQTFWSPFGPATPNIVITDESDFVTMFVAFQNGQFDITDWPLPAQNLSMCSNPDFWCSNPEAEFGIFQADINNHAPFLGTALTISRPSLTGSVANVVSGSSSACITGNGQLTLNVVNIEAGGVFKDSLNQITIANQPSGIPASLPTKDQGGANPIGTYVFPCILAGTYLISGSMVNGNSTSGSHLGCGVAAGCTVAIPAGSGGLGGTVSATWNVVWNSPSTLTPSAAFPNIMAAIAHLVDKPEFVQHDSFLNGHAACLDTFLAPAHLIQGSPCVTPPPGQPGTPLPASVISTECSSLVLDAVITSCAPISAYHLADANTPANSVWWGVPGSHSRGSVASGYASPQDIDAACQYLIKAGFALTGGTSNNCATLAQNSVGTTAPVAGTYTHFTHPSGTHFLVLLRTDPPRAHFGQIIADSINMLFGTPNDSGTCGAPCTQTDLGTATVLYIVPSGALQPTATFQPISVAVPIVFDDGCQGCADRWNMYTGGFSLGSTPEFLFSNYHSQFASFDCGGAPNAFPTNYDFHCDPGFDAITNAAEFQSVSSPTLSGSAAIFQEAAVRAFQFPIGNAMYSRIQQFVGLNGWNWQQVGSGQGSSFVSEKGHGFQHGFWSQLNMRQVPGFTPTSSIYTPGGGNPNLIRRAFSEDPVTDNPYQATTLWDLELIGPVFDTMLRVNPETGGANQQVIDWMTTSRSETFNPNELGCIAGPSVVAVSCVKGITTQTWHLRGDLFFHDGTPVTAQDIVYSVLTARDDPSASFFSSTAFVTNAFALDSRTVQVKLESNSAYYELNIGSLPIIPQHLFQGPNGSICGSISTASTPAGPVNVVLNGPSSACADFAFDPMTCTGSGGLVAGCGTILSDGSVQGIFVGSGPFICKNVQQSTAQAFGKPGGSCIKPPLGAGLIGPGPMGSGAQALFAGNTNYMRGPRGGQGSSLQKTSWGDFNKDGSVNILDGSNMAFFFDRANTYWAHPQYTCNPTTDIVDICVASALAVLFDTGNFNPIGGLNLNPSLNLIALDPQVDPYAMQLTTNPANTCLYYQTTSSASSTTRLALITCNTSNGTTLPPGNTITATAAVFNADGTLSSLQSGNTSLTGSIVTINFPNGLVSGSPTTYEIRIHDNNVQMGQFFVTTPSV